jgi:excisionase family DNA binding protein
MNEGPSSDDLTIDEVAETLNVSAAFVARLIERGVLAQTGSDAGARFKAAGVLAYRDRAEARAKQALREMTEDAEVLGLYDE